MQIDCIRWFLFVLHIYHFSIILSNSWLIFISITYFSCSDFFVPKCGFSNIWPTFCCMRYGLISMAILFFSFTSFQSYTSSYFLMLSYHVFNEFLNLFFFFLSSLVVSLSTLNFMANKCYI